MPDHRPQLPALRIDPALYQRLGHAAAAVRISRTKLAGTLLGHPLSSLLPDGERLDPDVLGRMVSDATQYAADISQAQNQAEETAMQSGTS